MPTIDEIQEALAGERARIEAQVGIGDTTAEFARVASAAVVARKSAKRSRDAAAGSSSSAAAAPAAPVRRSLRAAAQPPLNYAPPAASFSAAAAAAAPARRVEPAAGALRPDTVADSGSLKSHRARVRHMNDAYLGRLVPASIAGGGFQAKASVIFEACERPAGGGRAAPRPKFNKYAGLQQYANAFILFVNVGVRNDDGLTNSFGGDGDTITWFAASSATEQSPAILRLRHYATGHSYVPDVGGDGSKVTLAPADVALVCRLPGAEYVWCGDLEFVSMDAGSRPLGFVWRLKHAARLRDAPAFRALLKASL